MSDPVKPGLWPKPDKPEKPRCERCDGGLEFVTCTTRFGEQPAYQLFNCIACGFTNWIKA